MLINVQITLIMWFTLNVELSERDTMRVSFSNTSPVYTGYNYTILGKQNRKVPYLFNKVTDAIKGKGIPAEFRLGEDIIKLSPYSKDTAHALKKTLKGYGIRFANIQK